MSAPIPVLLAVQHVALSARLNEVGPQDVEAMLAQAEEMLDHGAPLYRAVTGFATQYMEVRRDEGALAMQGRILEEALHVELGLIAPAAARRDVDG
jgi:hypothetical protein